MSKYSQIFKTIKEIQKRIPSFTDEKVQKTNIYDRDVTKLEKNFQVDDIDDIDVHIYTTNDFLLDPIQPFSSGGYGQILLYHMKKDSTPVILKQYNQLISKSQEMSSIMKEIMILEQLNRYSATKTVKFYGVCVDMDRIYLVLERLEKTLDDKYIRTNIRLNPIEFKKLFHQIIEAVNAIHSLGFVHNDLKLSNIMLNKGDIKLIDFGLSEFLGISPSIDVVTDYISTDEIKAPDEPTMSHYVSGNRKSYLSDVYSLGSSLIHLIIKDYQQFTPNFGDGSIISSNDMMNITPYITNLYGQHLTNLLMRMIAPDMYMRPSCRDILNDIYFTDRSLMYGGGGVIDDLSSKQVGYTPMNYQKGNVELSYLPEIHSNYKDDIIPQYQIHHIQEYHTVMIMMLEKFNDPNEIISVIDSVINSQIVLKDTIDVFIDEKGPNDLLAYTLLIHDMYDSILMFHNNVYDDLINNPDYGYENEQKYLNYMIVDNLVGINHRFIPVWSHIVYVYIKLHHLPVMSVRIMNDVAKWVLFYFVQDTCYNGKLTIWSLVQCMYLKVISQSLKIPVEQLIGDDSYQVIRVSFNIYLHLESYYQSRMMYLKKTRQTELLLLLK